MDAIYPQLETQRVTTPCYEEKWPRILILPLPGWQMMGSSIIPIAKKVLRNPLEGKEWEYYGILEGIGFSSVDLSKSGTFLAFWGPNTK